MTVFGKRVFVDDQVKMSKITVLIKGGIWTQRHMHTERTPCEDWSDGSPKPGNCQKLGERPGTDPSLVPSEGRWPCQHLDFGLLASRTLRQ